jgi:hypothetical protein
MSFSPEIPSPASGLSIDAILKRTRPDSKPSNNLIPFAETDRESSESGETSRDLVAWEKRLYQTRAELTERERLINESEVLLSAKERLLDNREKVLAERMSSFARDGDIEWLRKTLTETQEALTMANDSLARKEETIDRMQRELDELKCGGPPAATVESSTAAEDPYASVTEPSLAEQEYPLQQSPGTPGKGNPAPACGRNGVMSSFKSFRKGFSKPRWECRSFPCHVSLSSRTLESSPGQQPDLFPRLRRRRVGWLRRRRAA